MALPRGAWERENLYAVTLLKAQGLGFSVPNDIATKKDLIKHFKVTEPKLNAFLKKSHADMLLNRFSLILPQFGHSVPMHHA